MMFQFAPNKIAIRNVFENHIYRIVIPPPTSMQEAMPRIQSHGWASRDFAHHYTNFSVWHGVPTLYTELTEEIGSANSNFLGIRKYRMILERYIVHERRFTSREQHEYVTYGDGNWHIVGTRSSPY